MSSAISEPSVNCSPNNYLYPEESGNLEDDYASDEPSPTSIRGSRLNETEIRAAENVVVRSKRRVRCTIHS